MLSIIIPFYNVEIKYLENIIHCLNNQTNKCFEAIFVNDYSNNKINYKKFIESHGFIYVDCDNEKKSNSLGLARDYGLSKSSGKYIWFVDADDYISSDSVDYLINSFQKNNDIDLIAFNFKRIKSENDLKNVNILCDSYKEKILTNKQKINNFYIDEIRPDWRVCFSKKFLIENKIFHSSEINLFEDIFYFCNYTSKAKKVLTTSKILYFYNRLNTGSILNSINNNDFILETYNSFLKTKELIKNSNLSFKDKQFILYPYFYVLFQFKFTFKQRIKLYKEYTKKIKLKLFFKIPLSRDWLIANFGWIIWILFGTIFVGKRYK